MIRGKRRWAAGLGVFWLTCTAAFGDAPETTRRIEFRITAPTMVAALIEFSEQARLQLVFPTDGTGQIAAPRVEGSLTPKAALEQLLRGSGLKFAFVNSRTVSVSLAKSDSAEDRITRAGATPR